MAAKTYYAARDMRHPIYRTRMLKAGDAVPDAGPLGALFEKRGFLTTQAPKKAAPKAETSETTADAPAKPKRKATRKKAATKK